MRLFKTINIGTIFRTRFRIHYTWLLVFLLIPWTVSTHFSTETSLITRILLGLATAFLFMVTVCLREMILLTIAVYKGIVVKTVTIFAFGGLIQPDYETTTPSHQILLAVTGMLLNFIITGIFYFSHLFFGSDNPDVVGIPLNWLAFFYFTLSLFHLIPAFPLEGGKIFRGILWIATDNIKRATRIAGISGWVMGFLITVGGILLAVLTSELFTGLFFISLGLIIQNSATHGIRHSRQIPDKLPPAPPVSPPEENGLVIHPPEEQIPAQYPDELPL
jgi:Zn-dependent protease